MYGSGIIGRKTKQVYLFCVPNRKHDTLIPYIMENIKPSSTVMTDKMASYIDIKRNESKLEQYGYQHMWVNHSVEFVSSYIPEVHSNTIERCWRSVRNSISTIKRKFSPKIVQEYLDVFVARSHFKEDELLVFMLISLQTLKKHGKISSICNM